VRRVRALIAGVQRPAEASILGAVSKLSRRQALKTVAAASAVAGCLRPTNAHEAKGTSPMTKSGASASAKKKTDAVVAVTPQGFPWQTSDPFLFCVHHDDHYPAGNERLGPAASLSGRNLGQDFEGKDGWRMYHGQIVPGFPQHPHRGFETVTVVRRGLLDHSDSMGATARYGRGDVQWLTAGRGIQHAEMFPLVERSRDNPLELFQIWLNLPIADKMVEPYFAMLWSHTIPKTVVRDAEGRTTEIAMTAGHYGDVRAPAPPPHSWAARPEADVAIWTIKLAPHARFTLPAAPGTNRSLYFFQGSGQDVDGHAIPVNHRVELRPELDAALTGGPEETEALLLQGKPIGEPVVNYGPFVMSTREEIRQAIIDFQTTGFGGWPWASADPVHAREEGRFARRPDGKVERPA
jgi:redox-sensitive bicupin YhaK (pirin superfamily)